MEKRNKIERLKEQCSPALFAQEIEKINWSDPSEADRFYLKNYGIYNIKLRPEVWMLRLRFDGGIISHTQLHTIAHMAQTHQLQILITARAQIELHHIPPEKVYPLWQALHKSGIRTRQTLTDNFRAIVTDPLDGLSSDTQIPTTALITRMRESFYAKPTWLGTIPRKFNTAVIGRETPSFNPWGNDLLFALAQKEGVWGFNLYLGGKNSEVAQDADIFCLPQEAPALFMAVAETYRSYGLRGSRAKIRLYHLIVEQGMAQVRRWIEESYGKPLPSAGIDRMHASNRHTIEANLQIRRYGSYGELSPDTLLSLLQESESETQHLRLTPHQELWVIDPKRLPAAQTANNHAVVTACAGSRYCPLSLWDIKQDLPDLPLQQLRQHGISLGFSGCLKGCGRHYHSDLGLIGLRTSNYGLPERAVRIFLGAVESPSPAPARMLYYVVPTRKLAQLLQLIIEDFEMSGYERFAQYSHHILRSYSAEFLQLWYMCRQRVPKEKLPYDLFFHAAVTETVEQRSITQLYSSMAFPQEQSLYDSIRILSHQLWDRDQ